MFDGVPVCASPFNASIWDESAGRVVCRELGYPGLVRISEGSEFGSWELYRGYAKGVWCNGDEERLEDCDQIKDSCWAGNLAGIVCIPGL